jgi:hypothetical protein
LRSDPMNLASSTSAHRNFSPLSKIAVAMVAVIIAGAGIYLYNIGILSGGDNTHFMCGTNKPTTINGANYCIDTATDNFMVPNPGFAYILNGSIRYMGVNFTTICPQTASSCTNSSSGVITPTALAINIALTFPDGTKETIGGVVGVSDEFITFSTHANPIAGVELLRLDESYAVYLLVQSA